MTAGRWLNFWYGPKLGRLYRVGLSPERRRRKVRQLKKLVKPFTFENALIRLASQSRELPEED